LLTRFLAGLILALSLPAASASAQEDSPFGGFKHDSSQPIEIVSDALEVRQAENLAIFSGEVEAAQDTLRLTADRVRVFYDQDQNDSQTGAIRRMEAEGNVFLSNGSETAQGATGVYDVVAGEVTMSGDVVLTQGGNAVSGSRLVIDMNTGVGRMEGGVTTTSGGSGRVRSIFTPSQGQN